jgi:hypothetical protein
MTSLISSIPFLPSGAKQRASLLQHTFLTLTGLAMFTSFGLLAYANYTNKRQNVNIYFCPALIAFPMPSILSFMSSAARDGDCWIDIYNLNGELVKKFPRVSLKAGENSAIWDGSNNSGQKVGQGIYFIVVHQPGGTATSKLVVITGKTR